MFSVGFFFISGICGRDGPLYSDNAFKVEFSPVVFLKRPLLALSILSAYARTNRLTRQLERSRGERRTGLLLELEKANAHLARLQDRYAGQDGGAGRPPQPS